MVFFKLSSFKDCSSKLFKDTYILVGYRLFPDNTQHTDET